MAHMKYIAYNAKTEEQINFKTLPKLASYFGLGTSTVSRWVLYGMPIIELADKQDQPKLIESQSKLRGFEIFSEEEWVEFNV